MGGQRDAKVVIIGCGIAGIAAAHKLVKAGFHHVRILEATGRSGGRIKTGRIGRELNAEDILPAQKLFLELINESSDFQSQRGEPWPSVGDFLRAQVQQHAAEKWKDVDEATTSLRLCVISNMLKVECCVNGTHSMDEVSMGAFGLYKTLPGLDCTFPGGYEGLTQNLMAELPAGLVTYNKPVRCVNWNSAEPVMVECDDGQKLVADHVIVTVPLGYLKKHHLTLFHPPLPLHKLLSVQRLGFGTNNKIFVEFDSPWWDADCEVIFFVWEDEDAVVDQVPDVQTSWIKKLFGFTVLKPTERYGHLLCGWISGHESEYMETLSEQQVTDAITQLIRRFTGNPIITPRRVLRSQWFHDPWTCGSYSNLGKGCSEQDLDNLMEPLPPKGSKSQPLQVLFAGEATHHCYFSTVHGAVLTGWREADRLISHYSLITPSEFPKPKF
ncbi:peroxisomal N(1)-acetyl-spermine/spermidine oxidase-like isoform X2 [Pelmatolapia mariae]|uniref:peroxisomal N(1)-acetyl-spermine/spermidine oxidase-like isoform X2 n=1 Tax=Pelmatolapia mariae TaxID=158779 RepID=UPI002FE6223F